MAELCMFGILDMYQVFQTLAKLQIQLSIGVLGKCAKWWKKKEHKHRVDLSAQVTTGNLRLHS